MKKEEAELMASFNAEELAELGTFIERTASTSSEPRMMPLEAVGHLARLALLMLVRAEKTEAEIAAWEKEFPPGQMLDMVLDEAEVAQVDALVEETSTPTRRLAREDVLHLLLKKERERAKRGESLRLYLEAPLGMNKNTKLH